MNENPYSLGVDASIPNERSIGGLLSSSRNAITMISLLCGLLALLIFVGLCFHLYLYLIAAIPSDFGGSVAWYLGQCIRGTLLGFMAFSLWRYQAAIKILSLDDASSIEVFARVHSRFWKVTAVLLIVQSCVAFSIVVEPFMDFLR